MGDDKVIGATFNEGQRLDAELFGAPLSSSWHRVILGGLLIPNFLIREHAGLFEVLFDDRWVYQFPEKWIARIAISMAANSYAVGMGYSHMGAKQKGYPFAPTVMNIEAPAQGGE